MLAFDHCFNLVALPSVLDAGERALLLQALRPAARLQEKLEAFIAAAPSPSLAAHVRRTDHWRLAKLFGEERYWPTIEDFTAQIEAQMRERRLACCIAKHSKAQHEGGSGTHTCHALVTTCK